MPEATATSLINSIRTIIRRFKFEELENAVLPVFPETSWDYVRSQLMKHREGFTTSNVAALIEKVINDEKLQVKELRERLIRLELIDVSRHKRKVWYTHSISSFNREPSRLGTIQFKQKLKEQLITLNKKEIDVETIIFNGIMYINIRMAQSRGSNISNYFAFFLGQKYLFSSKRNISQNFTHKIINTMGYSKSKSVNLHGKDLMSLMKLLRAKVQGALNPAEIVNSPIYRDAEPTIKSTGIDCAQEKQRKNFAEECFSKNPPTLEILAVKGPSYPISDSENGLELSDNIQVGWEFHSSNIATFLTTLAERGVLLPPFPPYIKNLMSMGKNSLTLIEEE